jgi:hypothetical protein
LKDFFISLLSTNTIQRWTDSQLSSFVEKEGKKKIRQAEIKKKSNILPVQLII